MRWTDTSSWGRKGIALEGTALDMCGVKEVGVHFELSGGDCLIAVVWMCSCFYIVRELINLNARTDWSECTVGDCEFVGCFAVAVSPFSFIMCYFFVSTDF